MMRSQDQRVRDRISRYRREIQEVGCDDTLDLSSMELTSLPPDILDLPRVVALDLSNNHLRNLPRELGRFENDLESLNLSGNELSEFPRVITRLRNLLGLYLGNNKLCQIPSTIARLDRLEFLDLADNQLTDLPAGLGKLLELVELDVSSNNLREIPAAIAGLGASLAELDLSDNVLATLPSNPSLLATLASLNVLNLSHNEFRRLPPEFGKFGGDIELRLDRNPLPASELAITEQGSHAIRTYCAALTKTRREWRSKLIVVGEGGVGKTSLLRRLRGQAFRGNEETTHGVAVDTFQVPHPQFDEVEMILKTWDFGGQQIYHATHQFFLSDRSLFVLVWNARLGFEQGRLHYWLDMIRAKAPNSPVLIVATHVDERCAQLPLKDIRREYPQVAANLDVSNKTGQGLDLVRNELTKLSSQLPLMGHEWPQTWLDAAEAVRTWNVTCVTPHELDEKLAESCVAVDARPVLSKMLHDLGDILHFDDNANLRDVVIRDPLWVTERISRVLESQHVANNLGLFTLADMEREWGDLESLVRQHLLHLMEAFDLSYRTLHDEEISLVVEHLSADEPDYIEQWDDLSLKGQISVRFRIEGNLPPGIPTWFIARQHRFTTHTHWRFGGLFADHAKKHLALIKALPHDRVIELTVRGPYPAGFFSLLMDGLELTLSRYPGLQVERMVPCPGHNRNCCNHEFRLLDLQRRLEMTPPRKSIECPVGLESVQVADMLSGIVPAQSDLMTRIDALSQSLQSKQSEILDKLNGQQRLHDASHKESQSQYGRILEEFSTLNERVQRHFLAQHRAVQSAVDSRCPNVFFTFPDMKTHWPPKLVGERIKLQLCCQAPGMWHPVDKGGCYDIADPHSWMQVMAPYLRGLLAVLKHIAPAVAPAMEVVGIGASTGNKNCLELTKALADMLPNYQSAPTSRAGRGTGADLEIRQVRGTPLRYFQRWLAQVDPDGDYGGLSHVVTPEGHHYWLCDRHAAEYRQ